MLGVSYATLVMATMSESLMGVSIRSQLFSGKLVVDFCLFTIGENDRLIAAVCLVAYGTVLLVLSRLQKRYRPAGICVVFSSVVMVMQPYLGQGKILQLAVSATSLLLSFAGEYYECVAHADTVLGTDRALAEKWGRVWKWVVGGQVALVISFPLLPYALPLAALMLLGSVFVLARIYLRKVLWLWLTAQTLRE